MFTGAELCSKLPPIVMLPGWGTVLLSKVFSRAATPNSFKSRSSRADSRDKSDQGMSLPASRGIPHPEVQGRASQSHLHFTTSSPVPASSSCSCPTRT